MHAVRNALLAVLLLSSLSATARADFDTDLASFKGRLFTTFVAGGGNDYAVYVLASKDGSSWEVIRKFDKKAAAQSIVNIAPRFTFGPDGHLMLSCAAFPKGLSVWATKDGKQWDQVKELVRPTCQLQNGSQVVNFSPDTRLVWDNKTAFYCRTGGICGEGGTVQIYSSQDGAEFGRHMDWMSPGGNDDYYDTTLLKTDSQLLCLTNTKYAAKLGCSKAPFKDWKWNDVVPAVRKPNLQQLPDGRLIVSAAIYQGGLRHALFELDANTGKLRELRRVPTNVTEPTRTGLTLHNGELWVAFRVKSGNSYTVRAERIDPRPADGKPVAAKDSVAAIVRQLLAEPGPEPSDSLAPGNEPEQAGRFPYEVLRRRDEIVEVLTPFEFATTNKSRRLKDGLLALGPQTRELVAPVLCNLLMSKDADQRARARDALFYLTEIPQSAVPTLLKATQNPSPEIRESGFRVLSWVEALPKSVEPIARKCLREAELGPQIQAAACLLSLNENDAETIKFLVDLINSPDFFDRIGKCNPYPALKHAGPGLLKYANHWKTNSRLWLEVPALLKGREAQAWPILLDWLEDKNTPRNLRWRILHSTVYVKEGLPRKRLAEVAAAVSEEDDPLLRKWALGALAWASKRGSDGGPGLPSIGSPTKIDAAFKKSLSPAGIRRMLKRIAENPRSSADRYLARDTLHFISSMGDRAKPLIPELKYLVDDHELLNLHYRAYAATALVHIDRDNPRWRTLLERWHSARFNDDTTQPVHRHLKRTIHSLREADETGTK